MQYKRGDMEGVQMSCLTNMSKSQSFYEISHLRHTCCDYDLPAEAINNWLGSEDLRGKVAGIERANDINIDGCEIWLDPFDFLGGSGR